MRGDVVRHDEPARLEQPPREREQRLVVVLLGVEEDEVERVLGRAQHLERIALDELRPLLEAGRQRCSLRQASHLAGSCSRETTRPPSTRAPAASQIDE